MLVGVARQHFLKNNGDLVPSPRVGVQSAKQNHAWVKLFNFSIEKKQYKWDFVITDTIHQLWPEANLFSQTRTLQQYTNLLNQHTN